MKSDTVLCLCFNANASSSIRLKSRKNGRVPAAESVFALRTRELSNKQRSASPNCRVGRFSPPIGRSLLKAGHFFSYRDHAVRMTRPITLFMTLPAGYICICFSLPAGGGGAIPDRVTRLIIHSDSEVDDGEEWSRLVGWGTHNECGHPHRVLEILTGDWQLNFQLRLFSRNCQLHSTDLSQPASSKCRVYILNER